MFSEKSHKAFSSKALKLTFMQKAFFIIFFLFNVIGIVGYSQNLVKFSGTLDSINLDKITLYKYGFRQTSAFDPKTDFSIPVDSNHHFKGEFQINEMGFYKLGDLFRGHTIFLSPGDSIFISLFKNPDSVRELVHVYYRLEPECSYPVNITFFDEMNKEFALPLKYNASFKTPEEFFRKQYELYTEQITLLKDFQAKKVVSNDFVKYATSELKSKYIIGTADIFGIVSNTAISENLLQLPFKFDFSDSLMAISTPGFQNAASLYNYYYLNKFDEKEPLKYFKKMYHSASGNFNGYIKEFLQGGLIVDYAAENSPDFDSLYHTFLSYSRNQEIRLSVINRVSEIQKRQKNIEVVNKEARTVFSDVVDRVSIQDMEGRNHSMQTIFPENQITVIDCWASWCYPCLVQIPFLDKIKARYRDKVNFVNLSFDKDVAKWINSVKKLNKNKDHTKEFLLAGEFSSLFSEHFHLEFIPRYILISKNGRTVLNADMPLPSKEADFIKILEEHL